MDSCCGGMKFGLGMAAGMVVGAAVGMVMAPPLLAVLPVKVQLLMSMP